MTWCRNTGDSEKRVLLLTAVAGAGKTSVAHSVADECARDGELLLSFFFRAGEQSRPDHLFSGMARSLAAHDPAYRSYVVSLIQKDPTLPTAPFPMQFKKLLAEPLRLVAPLPHRPIVIIIDALDECEKEAFEYLADILREHVPKLPSNFKFFLTSRQFDLVDRFLPSDSPIERLSINLSDDANMEDCKVYIRMQLRKLKDAHPHLREEELWEEDKLMQDILERAGGLFIWVSTVFRYMRGASPPMKVLEKLLDATADRSKAPAEGKMDNLYTSILEKCDWENDDFVHDYPIVMGAILIVQQPLTVEAWDVVLSPFLECPIRYTLAELSPLISGVGVPDMPIRILHQSFRDFLLERVSPQSSTLYRFAVDARRENDRVSLRCVEILNEDLSSLEGLGLVEHLSQKAQLAPILQGTLSEQSHYACQHIVYHLNQVQEPPEMLTRLVYTFLDQQIVHWVEVCVRMGGYISVSSFPEWAKPKPFTHWSKCLVICAEISFFLRSQEAYELANDSVTLCRCLMSVDSETYAVDMARSLGGLDASLTNLGRYSEARRPCEESVKLWRELVAIHPTSYTLDLAGAFRCLYVSFYFLAQHSEALPAIEESVKLCREVVAIQPTHKPELARGLRNLCISLSRLRRHSEELPVIEESVELSRELVTVDSALYAPELARGLRILRASLSRLGRHSDALLAAEECVNLWRQLVADHPMSYTPDLARALWELRVSLSNLGRHSEALQAIEESVNLWRKLVADHPVSYTQDLALALRNLSVSFDNLELYSEALPVIEESVKLWRELAAVHPTTYTPELARALRNLFVSLDKLGRHSDAVPVIEESVEFWRQLVVVDPILYAPGLAAALADLEATLDNFVRHSQARDREA
ncbi:uncharacterized protein EI90DRAFT_2946132 [Cantharellus anzutake]|uniref:uncharacterized protein n=1 Tax=Cantharellus anzutake TaxID=1750568 RepID=UPI0019065C64|nr:uncharacterized protein EI90DRAFT_2946132 [Cantharellus anzutake]KAF8315744.1 hypothetical protein EI90DRAFT_2946132 [Cantharellus anzutake]